MRIGDTLTAARVTVGSHDEALPFAQLAHFVTIPHGGAGQLAKDAGCGSCVALRFAFSGNERAAYAMADVPLPNDTIGLTFDLQDDGSAARLRVAFATKSTRTFCSMQPASARPAGGRSSVRFPPDTQASRLIAIYVLPSKGIELVRRQRRATKRSRDCGGALRPLKRRLGRRGRRARAARRSRRVDVGRRDHFALRIADAMSAATEAAGVHCLRRRRSIQWRVATADRLSSSTAKSTAPLAALETGGPGSRSNMAASAGVNRIGLDDAPRGWNVERIERQIHSGDRLPRLHQQHRRQKAAPARLRYRQPVAEKIANLDIDDVARQRTKMKLPAFRARVADF